MFRYERPQKGRYRQFYQLGAEVFGLAGPDIDAELLQLCDQFWRALGIDSMVTLELNSMGSNHSRGAYRRALLDYLTPLQGQLDADSQRRLATNPLRILDSKSEVTQALLADAPQIGDFLDNESRGHFADLCGLLTDLGIDYTINPRLVRGLDYYTNTVFEWTTDALGAQGTICGGGRYDGLVELLGGKPTPGAGFAMGLERVALLYDQVAGEQAADGAVDVYCCVMAQPQHGWAMQVAQRLRDACPGARIRVHAGGGKLKNQLRKADASGAAWALIIGEDEMVTQQVAVKSLRDAAPQQTVSIVRLIELLRSSYEN
jgi:histidyl-tRNA synthetase